MDMRRLSCHCQPAEEGAPAGDPAAVWLIERAGEGWRELYADGWALAERLRFLPWPERLQILSAFCWQQAQEMLSPEAITGMVNRRSADPQGEDAVRRYAARTSAVMAAVLLLLGEEGRVFSHASALVHLFTGDPDLQRPALDWLAASGSDGLHPLLARLPGLAFLCLCLYTNDSAESFMARDAFFAALQGE